jgi:small-conductance mechanosensitive channel
LKVGHTVEVGENYGTIERLHPTQVEIRRLDGRSVLINYTEFMNTPIVVENLGSTEG